MTDWFQYRDGIDKHCEDCYQHDAGICCYTEKKVEPLKVCGLFIRNRLTTDETGYTLDFKE